MNKEKLNELRSKITIPLAEALALLKQYDENIERCIQAYHDENIGKISEEIGCDERKAQLYYQKIGFDMQKIQYQHNKNSHIPCIILKYGERIDIYPRVGFTILAEDINYNENISSDYQQYFAYLEDCDEVLPIIKSLYPIYNHRFNKIEKDFDVCSKSNYFEHSTIHKLVDQLKGKANNSDSQELSDFIYSLIACLEQQMKFGHYVVIAGNL